TFLASLKVKSPRNRPTQRVSWLNCHGSSSRNARLPAFHHLRLSVRATCEPASGPPAPARAGPLIGRCYRNETDDALAVSSPDRYGAWGQGLGVAGPSTLWRFHDHQSHPSRCRIRRAPRHRGAGSSLEPRARGASGSQELLARGRDVGRRTWIRHTRAGSTARPDGLRRRAAVALDCHRSPRGTGPAADGVGFLAEGAQTGGST